jgi:hypothetical protein
MTAIVPRKHRPERRGNPVLAVNHPARRQLSPKEWITTE